MKFHKFYAFILAAFPLFSCATRIDGALAANGRSKLDVNASLEPRITSLVRTLAAAGGQAGGLILDGPAIAKSLSASSYGDVHAVFQNTSPSAIKGNMDIGNINRLFIAGDAERFVVFEQGKDGGKCKFNIDLESGPVFLGFLSAEFTAYLNVLMAPLATGEKMTKAEYLALVSSVFNKAISDEIAASRIRIAVGFPGQITSAAGAKTTDRLAEFDIPLLDILVLETPVTYEVSWK